MAKSKALSPEVQGLLEKVRLQAQQYSEAFDYFENKKVEFDRLFNDLEQKNYSFTQFLQQIKIDIAEIKSDFNTTISSNFKHLTDEVQKYNDFNDNYHKVISFIEELKLFQKDFTENISHYENNLEDFKSDLGYDVDNSINTLHKYIDDEIDKNIIILKKDISTRFSIAERMIVELKNQLIQENKNSENEIGIINNLLEKVKNENLNYNSALEKNLKNEKNRIKNIEKDINDRFNNANKKITKIFNISKFIKETGNTTQGSEDDDFTITLSKYFQPAIKIESKFQDIQSDFDNKVTNINDNLEDLNHRFQKNKNMMIAFFGFGFFFIIAIIIIIISSVL